MKKYDFSFTQLRNSSFHVNAFFLMASTFVLAGTGFIFWAIVTRMNDSSSVGLATTLLSVSGLISLLGLAGFDATFVRYLPRAHRKAPHINTGVIVVTVLSTLLSLVAGLVLPLIMPEMQLLGHGGFLLCFVLFTVVGALNILTNAVFLAYKQARYIFIINALFGSSKIALPFCFSSMSGSEMIFLFVGISQFVGLALSLLWIHKKFQHKFAFTIDRQALRLIRKFSSSVYVSSIFNLLPPTIIPLIVTNVLSPKDAAYYYMAFTIAGVLYTIAYASMQSVFAEGSHNVRALSQHVRKATKLILLLLLPAIVAAIVLSGPVLTVFGGEYAMHASGLLQLFSLGALPVAVYSAIGAVFKVKKNLAGIVVMNGGYALAIIMGCYMLLPRLGVVGVGWSWVIGNSLACIIGGIFLLAGRQRGKAHDVVSELST